MGLVVDIVQGFHGMTHRAPLLLSRNTYPHPLEGLEVRLRLGPQTAVRSSAAAIGYDLAFSAWGRRPRHSNRGGVGGDVGRWAFRRASVGTMPRCQECGQRSVSLEGAGLLDHAWRTNMRVAGHSAE